GKDKKVVPDELTELDEAVARTGHIRVRSYITPAPKTEAFSRLMSLRRSPVNIEPLPELGLVVIAGKDKGVIRTSLKGIDKRKSLTPGKRKPPGGPKVWKRDAGRPTFARVYVGDKNSLKLVSLHVTVHIEGSRARTLVDHVFHNPHRQQLEGTFEYPLPA